MRRYTVRAIDSESPREYRRLVCVSHAASDDSSSCRVNRSAQFSRRINRCQSESVCPRGSLPVGHIGPIHPAGFCGNCCLEITGLL